MPPRARLGNRTRRIAVALPAAAGAALALPSAALAHNLSDRYQAPLPLVVFIAGAALAVAVSFVFVMMRSSGPERSAALEASRPPTVPRWLRALLATIGIVAWVWIVAQTLFGGAGDGDVASLFLWNYGWVGVALISALLGPAWAWIDPFSTLHRALRWLGSRLRLSGGKPAVGQSTSDAGQRWSASRSWSGSSSSPASAADERWVCC